MPGPSLVFWRRTFGKGQFVRALMHTLVNRICKFRIPPKVVIAVVGLLSTAWFLIRVIPKPSRCDLSLHESGCSLDVRVCHLSARPGGHGMCPENSTGSFSRGQAFRHGTVCPGHDRCGLIEPHA